MEGVRENAMRPVAKQSAAPVWKIAQKLTPA